MNSTANHFFFFSSSNRFVRSSKSASEPTDASPGAILFDGTLGSSGRSQCMSFVLRGAEGPDGGGRGLNPTGGGGGLKPTFGGCVIPGMGTPPAGGKYDAGGGGC